MSDDSITTEEDEELEDFEDTPPPPSGDGIPPVGFAPFAFAMGDSAEKEPEPDGDADSDSESVVEASAPRAPDIFASTYERFGLKPNANNTALAQGVVATKKALRIGREHIALAFQALTEPAGSHVSRGMSQATRVDKDTVRLSVPEIGGGSLRINLTIPDYLDLQGEIED